MKTATRNFILIILIIILGILVYFFYNNIVYVKRGSNIFTKQAEKIVEENEDPVFKINQIILYSSAYAVDNSEENTLQDLDIHQYTDIAIYIDNNSNIEELTEENTINEIYIDNIKIESNYNIGNKVLNYKNPISFGIFQDLGKSVEEINFDITHTNNENNEKDYDNPTFFTDCSNPITIGYVNKNILQNYEVSEENSSIAFDGTILRDTNIDLKKLNCEISFTIHIRNNLNEEYICNVNIDNNLESDEGGIYTGYIMRIQNTSEITHSFFKLARSD